MGTPYIPNMVPVKFTKYVEDNIKPLYELEKSGHDWKHIEEVMLNMSILLQKAENSSMDDGTIHPVNCYLAVVFHDFSLAADIRNKRETHEIDSGMLFQMDEFIRQNLDPPQINKITDAIYKHRASSGEQKRTTLGKLLFQADRCFYTMKPEDVFKRSFTFNRKHNCLDTDIEVSIKAVNHLIEKYGEHGYAYDVIYFPEGTAEFRNNMKVFLDEARLLLGDKIKED